LLQKHSRLFAVLETLDNGKPIREARDVDVPLAQRHFYYHAGMAQLMESELPDAEALGVCGQIIPWNFPLLMAAWKLAPALAAGCVVVLKPAEQTPASILVLAELIGDLLPPGVLNVVNGYGKEAGQALAFLPVSVLPTRLDRLGVVALAGQPLVQEWYLIRLRERTTARIVDLLVECLLGEEARSTLLRLGLSA